MQGSEVDLMEDQFMSFFSREIQRQAAKSTCLEAQFTPSDQAKQSVKSIKTVEASFKTR